MAPAAAAALLSFTNMSFSLALSSDFERFLPSTAFSRGNPCTLNVGRSLKPNLSLTLYLVRLTMKLLKLVVSAFFILSLAHTLSLPPNAVTSTAAQVSRPDQTNHSCCVCPLDGTRQYKRSHHGEVSVSPGEGLQPSSQANSTSGQQSSNLWPPTVETILTVIFRVVVTLLSLLNVGFTWRIHGMSFVPNT